MFGVVFLFFFFLTSNQSLAQSSKNPKESGKNDSAENKLRISIPVPAPAKGELKREQFKITEDGFPQAIASLEKPNQSVSYGLIIDTSGSMQFRLPELELLARSLINQLSDKDEMALATSKSKEVLLCDLNSRKDLVRKDKAQTHKPFKAKPFKTEELTCYLRVSGKIILGLDKFC